MPNEADFLKNERPNEYEARFTVEGGISITIKADSLEEAQAKAAAMVDDDEFGHELDEVTLVETGRVWKTPPMFLVVRDGREMQVSRLAEGDLPRQPSEHGF